MAMTPNQLPPDAARFWARFLASPAAAEDAPTRLYGTMQVGNTAASANNGAKLILEGIKTATSSLAAEYSGAINPPRSGDLTVVLDGRDRAVCIVETTEAVHRPFAEADDRLAWDYGEWDRTLATWRRECRAFYTAEASALGITWSDNMPLVFERFRVVFPNV